MTERRVLISTLPPDWGGGVPRMAAFAADCLRGAGFEPVVAWYRPFTESPGLSVALSRPGGLRVGVRPAKAFRDNEAWEIGAFLPEFEFNQYRASAPWRRLMDGAHTLFSVSGNCLAAQPFLEQGRMFVAWVATPWRDDRREREKAFSPARRFLDARLVRPVIERLEKSIVGSGHILPLSAYTRDRLQALTGISPSGRILPMPIELDRFSPEPQSVRPGRLGFVGRLNDPRKRLDLLLAAMKASRGRGFSVEALLVGGPVSPGVLSQIAQYGLENCTRVMPSVPTHDVPALLRTVDVFVIPSDQEGLCIAGLEAMACGCPVISTRCGGPEEYVIDGETGALVSHDAEAIAEAAVRIVSDRRLRTRLSLGARALVEERYSPGAARQILLGAFMDSQEGRC